MLIVRKKCKDLFNYKKVYRFHARKMRKLPINLTLWLYKNEISVF